MEQWSVKGRFGTHDRYGITVTFSSTAVVSDVDPPDLNSRMEHAAVVNWAIIDHEKQKYYRLNAADDNSAALLSMLIATKRVRDQPHMMQAVIEQINAGRLVLPDQLLGGNVITRQNTLDLEYGKNTLKCTVSRPTNEQKSLTPPLYTLHLEGVSCEEEEKDAAKEVRVVVDLTFVPRSAPTMLDGIGGIVSNGDWEQDAFSYCTHHTRILSGSLRITRASDALELVRELDIKRGTVWVQHTFGGIVARSVEEALFIHELRKQRITEDGEKLLEDHCLIRLHNSASDTLSITSFYSGSSGKVHSCYATVQSGTSKKGYQFYSDVELSGLVDGSFLSSETSIVYPTRWCVKCPLYDGQRVELSLNATIPAQEMVTAMEQPSVWEGTVDVSGKVYATDGTTTDVSGDGFVTARGRGKLNPEKAIFAMLHDIGSAAMERVEVAAFSSWTDIADGPAVKALGSLKMALKTQNFELSPTHALALAALFGVYGFIFHHPHDVIRVKEALEWCYNRWVTFFGSTAISYRTLTIRAFMMQELCDVMHAKSAGWIPKEAAALDIAVPVNYLSNSHVGDSAIHTLPARSLLLQPASSLEIAQIKALMDGTWVMDPDETVGSLNAVLIEQGVGVLWRSVHNNTVPTWRVNVDQNVGIISIAETTMLERRHFTVMLTGSEWTWASVSRGPLRARACLLASGSELYMETEVRGGIERVWYSFHDEGKKMIQYLFFFPTPTTAKPVASCERHFALQIRPMSPLSP